MDSSSFQQYKNICNSTCILTENQKKPMPCHTKFEQFLEPVSSLAKQRGSGTQTTGMHGLTDIASRSAESSWRSTFQTVQTTCLWSRESEVNNVCWKCPHHFNSDPRPVDCKRSRSLVGERFSMLQLKPLTDKLFWQPIADWSAIIDNHLPTTEFLRKPPKKVVVGGRREVIDVILWQPIADWRRSSTNICRHLTTSGNHPKKKVVVGGRRLVVAIVWLTLKEHPENWIFHIGQLSSFLHRSRAHTLYASGGLITEFVPFMLCLGWSGGSLNSNLWKRFAKKRKVSIFASCSPRHSRRPAKQNHTTNENWCSLKCFGDLFQYFPALFETFMTVSTINTKSGTNGILPHRIKRSITLDLQKQTIWLK